MWCHYFSSISTRLARKSKRNSVTRAWPTRRRRARKRNVLYSVNISESAAWTFIWVPTYTLCYFLVAMVKKNSDVIRRYALIRFFVILGVKSENPGEKQTDQRYVRNIIFFIVNIIQSSWNFLHICPKYNWKENVKKMEICKHFWSCL